MKDIAIIIGFAAFTAVPPVIAGSYAPATFPEAVDGTGYSDSTLFVPLGAICSSRQSSAASAQVKAALASKPALLEVQGAERLYSQAE